MIFLFHTQCIAATGREIRLSRATCTCPVTKRMTAGEGNVIHYAFTELPNAALMSAQCSRCALEVAPALLPAALNTQYSYCSKIMSKIFGVSKWFYTILGKRQSYYSRAVLYTVNLLLYFVPNPSNQPHCLSFSLDFTKLFRIFFTLCDVMRSEL